MRLAWRYYSLNRKQALAAASSSAGYTCNKCSKVVSENEIAVDHIKPVVDPQAGFVDWSTFMERLFCEADNLSVICKSCHRIKTSQEERQRKLYKTGRFAPAALRRMRETLKGHTFLCGIPKTKAHCEAMSRERRGKPQTPARVIAWKRVHENNRVPLVAINIKTGERKEFASIEECSKILGLNLTNVCRTLHGSQNRTQHKGWRFEQIKTNKEREARKEK